MVPHKDFSWSIAPFPRRAWRRRRNGRKRRQRVPARRDRRAPDRAHSRAVPCGPSTSTSSSTPTPPGTCSGACCRTRISSSTTRPGTTSRSRRSSAGSRSINRSTAPAISWSSRACVSFVLTVLSHRPRLSGRTPRREPPGRVSSRRCSSSAQPVVIHKTLEIRPDVPGASFFVGGALVPASRAARARALPARHVACSGRRALPRGRHHVHAEDAVCRSGRARWSRALDPGGRPPAPCSSGRPRS